MWVKNGGFLLFSDVPQNIIYDGRKARGRNSS